jgi:hypothetical protein
MKPQINIIVLTPLDAWGVRVLDFISVIYLFVGSFKLISVLWLGWTMLVPATMMITGSYIMSKIPKLLFYEKQKTV